MSNTIILEKPTPIDGRRVGNTTRLVDYYIQQLFITGEVILEDHHPLGHNDLFAKVMGRLRNEHPYLFFAKPEEGDKEGLIWSTDGTKPRKVQYFNNKKKEG